jgi:hypothetical protein
MLCPEIAQDRVLHRGTRLSNLPEFPDQLLIVEWVDDMDVYTHQIHVWLQKGCQFMGIIGLHKQKACTTSRQVIPTLDALRIIGPRLVLLDNAPGNLLTRGVWVPAESAIP